MQRPVRNDEGMLLVVVLWGLIALSVLAAGFAIASRAYTRAIVNSTTSVRLAAIAAAGISGAVLELADPVHRAPGANRPAKPSSCRATDDMTLAVTISDEAGKIDLNYGDERLLRRLLAALNRSPADAAAIVDRIVDFRDGDDLRRPAGAEAADYRAAGVNYGPANREFLSVDELEQVLYLPTVLVDAIRPFVTVHSRLMGIDPDVADVALLRALSQGTAPQTGAPAEPPLTWDALALPPELRMHTSRTTYALSAVAVAKSGGAFVREAVVIFQPDGTVRMASWQRGQLTTNASGVRERCR